DLGPERGGMPGESNPLNGPNPGGEWDSVHLQNSYVIRRKFFKLLGEGFYIYDAPGNLAFYSDMKAFRLRDDIRLYTDSDMRQELLSIRARQMIDFSGTFDVV